MVILSGEQYKEVNQNIDNLLNQIDIVLAKNNYESASRIILSEEVVLHSSYSSTLYHLRILNTIYLEEIRQGIKEHIFMNRNISQLEQTYTQLCFYLRRLEFDLPLDLQEEIIPFIINEHLSLVCIMGTIKQTQYFYSKDSVFNKFRSLIQTI